MTSAAPVLAATICLIVAPVLAGGAWAQTRAGSSSASSTTSAEAFVTRQMARYDALRARGISLNLGSILPGSSFAFGAGYARDRLWGTPLGLSVAGAYSVRGYSSAAVRFGLIRDREKRAEIDPVDADLTHVFNDRALSAGGPTLFLDVRHRDYPRVDFFGLGQHSDLTGISDYRVRGPSVDLVSQWQWSRHAGVSMRAGTLRLRIQPGRNHGVPNTDERYTPETAPGLDGALRYRVIGGALTLDYRDRARLTSRGTFAGFAVWRGAPAEHNDARVWTRAIAEVRQFISIHGSEHVLALHGLASMRIDGLTTPMPFDLEPTLGGTKTLRGFGSYRLRDDNAWTATVEYRWRAAKHVEIAPFVDLGGVATRLRALRRTPPAVTPGIGVRGLTKDRVIVRVDTAHSRDGTRVMLTLSTPF